MKRNNAPSSPHNPLLPPLGLGLFMRRRGDNPATIQRTAALFAGLLLIGVALLLVTQAV